MNLDTARATMVRHLTDRADILRSALEDDGFGHTIQTDHVVGEGVPCRLVEAGSSVSQQGDRAVSLVDFDVYLPHGQDVLPGDSLVVGGKVLRVSSTDAGRTGALTLVATCSVVE